MTPRDEVKRNREAWVAALRSGDYKQGRMALHPSDDTWCCLGVGACVLAEIYEKDRAKWPRYSMSGSPMGGGWLGVEAQEKLGIMRDEVSGKRSMVELAQLNDDSSQTFKDIAKVIEDMPLPKEEKP